LLVALLTLDRFVHFLFLAGSKFPFVNMQQTQNNWPGMHMGFNQNSNDGGFGPHQNNMPQQPQQHKSSGEEFWFN
jgi:hypothetical protein